MRECWPDGGSRSVMGRCSINLPRGERRRASMSVPEKHCLRELHEQVARRTYGIALSDSDQGSTVHLVFLCI